MITNRITFLAISFALSGCVALQPIEDQSQVSAESAVDGRIEHQVASSAPQACGSLNQFLFDVHKLSKQSQKTLLDDLSAYKGDGFSCDRLKTGLLLSQIGKTISEDNLAIEILNQYRKADKLTYSDQRLITILLHHSEERKRLHVVLQGLGTQLISEKALSKNMAVKFEALQQQLNQLQQLESEINETEQSIAAPVTTGLSETTPENTGS